MTNHRHGAIVVVGPTAVGKTKLGVELATAFQGEIISADSMQIYRRMDIGTAKIQEHEMKGVPHWAIDIVEPTESFSVAQYRDLADQLLSDIWGRGHLPFFVGGTGLYIRAVTEEFNFAESESYPLLRSKLEAEARLHGAKYLHERLKKVDPITAARLHPNDQRRIIRAIEIYEVTGHPMSEMVSINQDHSRFPTLKIGLTMANRQTLYDRIDHRVDLMMEQGLIDEVKKLLEDGIHNHLISMQGIGYKEIIEYLDNRISLEEAIDKIKQGSRRYAKRQLSWFRRDPDIHWFQTDQIEWEQLYRSSFELVKEFQHQLSNTVEIKEDGGSTHEQNAN